MNYRRIRNPISPYLQEPNTYPAGKVLPTGHLFCKVITTYRNADGAGSDITAAKRLVDSLGTRRRMFSKSFTNKLTRTS